MARVFTSAGIVHPDELDGDGAGQAVEVVIDESTVAAAELTEAGYVRDPSGNWWTAPDGKRLNGWRAAQAHHGG